MKAIHRITVSAAVLAGSILIILFFSHLGTRTRGPLQDALAGIGRAVSEVENRIVMSYRGPGRRDRLSWLDPYRRDPARLKAPDRILLGAWDDRIPRTLEGIVELEESLDTTLPLIHFFVAWGDRPDEQFPARLLGAIRDLGSVPVITWEPWLTDFDRSRHPHLPPKEHRDKNGLAAVARGDYDFYIDRWAHEAREYGGPIFIRLGHEMNDPYRYPWGPQNNRPEDFTAAWRRVVDRFRAAGAVNTIWVWSPHPAYGFFDAFYPGDDYVDWVGSGVLNYGTVAHWSRWWTFQEIFGDHYTELAAFGKPIMITEFGTLSAGGDPAAWYREALTDLPERHPLVRSILFFHSSGDATVTDKTLVWSFAGDSTITRLIAGAVDGWSSGGPPAPRRAPQAPEN
jgi:hypothetical protein